MLRRLLLLVLIIVWIALSEIERAQVVSEAHHKIAETTCQAVDLQQAVGRRDEYIRRCLVLLDEHGIPHPSMEPEKFQVECAK